MVAVRRPRGRKDNLEIVRDDFWVTTCNKQLNFVQHIKTILDINGRAGVVLPDNVLFEGGAGETLRRRLLKEFDVHTLLRLPTGTFYAGGVKANVVFFEKRPAGDHPWTKSLWVYDLRTNQHFTQKVNPLRTQHLDDFVASYLPGRPRSERIETDRFKPFTYEEIIARDKANLDLLWLKDDSLEDAADLPAPTCSLGRSSRNSKSHLKSSPLSLSHLRHSPATAPCRSRRIQEPLLIHVCVDCVAGVQDVMCNRDTAVGIDVPLASNYNFRVTACEADHRAHLPISTYQHD